MDFPQITVGLTVSTVNQHDNTSHKCIQSITHTQNQYFFGILRNSSWVDLMIQLCWPVNMYLIDPSPHCPFRYIHSVDTVCHENRNNRSCLAVRRKLKWNIKKSLQPTAMTLGVDRPPGGQTSLEDLSAIFSVPSSYHIYESTNLFQKKHTISVII